MKSVLCERDMVWAGGEQTAAVQVVIMGVIHCCM